MSNFSPVLRIHLILMRIRILDPHWKKMDPDPGSFFKIYLIFLRKLIFKFVVLFFFACSYPKTYKPFRNEEIFIISLFSKVQNCFFLQFLVHILPLGSGSRKPKSCGSNGSGFLSTAFPIMYNAMIWCPQIL